MGYYREMNGRVGIFDSGLGGLFMMKAIVEASPRYDYVYLGDTQRLPYGNHSSETVYMFLREAVTYLFKQQQCALIVVACNTASAEALRRIQHEYLPFAYPDRRVLGVIIPAAEAVLERGITRVGVLATEGTVRSGAFTRELKKLNHFMEVFQEAAPLLVPLIENGDTAYRNLIVQEYVSAVEKHGIDGLLLGCTHYPILKAEIRAALQPQIQLVCQDEIVPGKLKNYLRRHPEIDEKLGKNGEREFLVTDITPTLEKKANEWFGKGITLEVVEL